MTGMNKDIIMDSKETVILVHGTFAKPDHGKGLQWYEPGHPVGRELDTLLSRLGTAAKCWNHLGSVQGETAANYYW